MHQSLVRGPGRRRLPCSLGSARLRIREPLCGDDTRRLCAEPVNGRTEAAIWGGLDRNGPCKSRWLGYFVDREVGAIW